MIGFDKSLNNTAFLLTLKVKTFSSIMPQSLLPVPSDPSCEVKRPDPPVFNKAQGPQLHVLRHHEFGLPPKASRETACAALHHMQGQQHLALAHAV